MFILSSSAVRSKVLHFISIPLFRPVSRAFSAKMSSDLYIERARQCVPFLSNELHKGEAGRIGVVGGSFEYTGAPYFAAISALKLGSDTVHLFCCRDAAIPIKSYSPELMVHGVLDDPIDPIKLIKPWLDRLHVLVIGPGLGRDPTVLATIRRLFDVCRELKMPVVIDADALFVISQDLSLIANYPGAIITPNLVEFARIFGDGDDHTEKFDQLGASVTILKKGFTDTIYSGVNKVGDAVTVHGGKARRCGGQGDILSGCTAVFYAWALKAEDTEAAKVACVGASHFLKALNETTFGVKGRSMTASDMINHIHEVFDTHFEHK